LRMRIEIAAEEPCSSIFSYLRSLA